MILVLENILIHDHVIQLTISAENTSQGLIPYNALLINQHMMILY